MSTVGLYAARKNLFSVWLEPICQGQKLSSYPRAKTAPRRVRNLMPCAGFLEYFPLPLESQLVNKVV
ncbi:MAG: hypothetical protein H7095_00975 [Pseudopedobacter sp.]|nr:hypothetical protein [Deinococcales bacterium]